jgi:hypothetical protein
MAKYVIAKCGDVLNADDVPVISTDSPVVVLQMADWKRIVRYCDGWTRKDRNCPTKSDDIEIDAIIKKVEEDNG